MIEALVHPGMRDPQRHHVGCGQGQHDMPTDRLNEIVEQRIRRYRLRPWVRIVQRHAAAGGGIVLPPRCLHRLVEDRYAAAAGLRLRLTHPLVFEQWKLGEAVDEFLVRLGGRVGECEAAVGASRSGSNGAACWLVRRVATGVSGNAKVTLGIGDPFIRRCVRSSVDGKQVRVRHGSRPARVTSR